MKTIADQENFKQYLVQNKKSLRRIPVYIDLVNEFFHYLSTKCTIDQIDHVTESHLQSFLKSIETIGQPSPFVYATSLRLYCTYRENKRLIPITGKYCKYYFENKSMQKKIRRVTGKSKLPHFALPQVVAIIAIAKNNMVLIPNYLLRIVNPHSSKFLYVYENDEFFISSDKNSIMTNEASKSSIEIPLVKGRINLPEYLVERMELKKGDSLAFIAHDSLLVIKKIVLKQSLSNDAYPHIIDREYPYTLIREAQKLDTFTNIINTLQKKNEKMSLSYDLYNYLKGKDDFAHWYIRKYLHMQNSHDTLLQKSLIENLINTQERDGSWRNLPRTIRVLRELADLECNKDKSEIKKGIQWILERPESTYNSGMFFLEDEMIAQQQEIINKRIKTGTYKERFRNRKKRYMNLISSCDDVSIGACGPQIMWPTALTLEMLLKWGYEKNERIQRLLKLLFSNIFWCECQYQLGTADRRNQGKTKLSDNEANKLYNDTMAQVAFGGVENINALLQWHISDKQFKYQKRYRKINDHTYEINTIPRGNGCGFYILRALAHAKDKAIHPLVDVNLWQLVTCQQTDGSFTDTGIIGDYVWFSVIADWHHPAATFIAHRAVPWLLKNQNKDGSWGDEQNKGHTTMTVVKVLKKVKLV